MRIGVSPQVNTRVIRELEAELGEPLFHRSTRGVRLTHFGATLASRSAEAIAGIDDIFAGVPSGAHDELAGVVRISAPTALGRRLIAPGLAPLLASHPLILVDLRLSEVLADVVVSRVTSACALDRCEIAASSLGLCRVLRYTLLVRPNWSRGLARRRTGTRC